MQRIFFVLLAAALAIAAPASAQAQVQRAPLDLFVGYDAFRGADLSPNGRYVAVIHREQIGDVLTIIDLETNQLSRTQVARADQQMRLDWVQFKTDNRLIFRLSQQVRIVAGTNTMFRVRNQDDAFEWDGRYFASNLDGSGLLPLYDPSANQGFDRHLDAGIISTMDSDPEHVLLIVPAIGGPELWRVNVNTGAHTSLEHGNRETYGWDVDGQGTVVLRIRGYANGRGFAYARRGPGQTNWVEFANFIGIDAANSGPTFEPVGPAPAPGQLYVLARRGDEDTSGLYIFDTSTGQYSEPIVANASFDVQGAVFDGRTNTILAGCWIAHRVQCEASDPAFGRTWNAIVRALGDNVNAQPIATGGPNRSRWLVYTNGPQDLGTYYLFDSNTRQLRPLFGARPEINSALLPSERVVEYTTSDGQRQWGYFWIPPGVADARNLPTIVMPHGGPESRDVWGDTLAQAFASQGYAVFQPNFRGGGGFGRRFVQAGWRQWGQRIQADVTEGVRALIEQGMVDANRICIWGWSHGGYVAATAAFMNADLYKCSVAGAPITDQVAFLRWARDGEANNNDVAPSGGAGGASATYRYWSQAMGGLGADETMLAAHSAAQNAERVTIPLLLIHGDEDWTVPFEQSQIMERAMRRAGRPVRLVTLRDMDHYYSPENAAGWRTAFTESLTFFNQHIGPGVAPSGGAQ